MRERLTRLLLVAALLAGWQLALVHPLQHVDGRGDLVHLDGKDSGSPELLCDLIAALGACAPVYVAQMAPPCCGNESPAFRDFALHLAAAAPPFLSQGPPALL